MFVDLTGPKPVRSRGGKEYMMIVRDDFSRYTRVFFLRGKYETADYFSQYLTEIAPRKVEIVRSDCGGEFRDGAFGELCRKERIKQEFTTADSPEYNGVAERQIGIIEAAGLAARIQAEELYPNENFPRGENMWAEQAHWACHAINCTATTANPGWKTPHEMWFGSPPSSRLIPFLKPGFRKKKRGNKLHPKAEKCWYIGHAPNFPSDAMRVNTETGKIIVTRHVTWAHVVSPIISHAKQRVIPAPTGVDDPSGDGSDSGAESAPSSEKSHEFGGESEGVSESSAEQNHESGGESGTTGEPITGSVEVTTGIAETVFDTEEARRQAFRDFVNSGPLFEQFVARYRQPRTTKPAGMLDPGESKDEEPGTPVTPLSTGGGEGKSPAGEREGTFSAGGGEEISPVMSEVRPSTSSTSLPPASTPGSGEGRTFPSLTKKERRNLEWGGEQPRVIAGRTRQESREASKAQSPHARTRAGNREMRAALVGIAEGQSEIDALMTLIVGPELVSDVTAMLEEESEQAMAYACVDNKASGKSEFSHSPIGLHISHAEPPPPNPGQI